MSTDLSDLTRTVDDMTTTTMTTEDVLPEVALTPCPDWCRSIPGHGWDSWDPDTGLQYRGHAGPSFGEGVSVGGDEASDGTFLLNYFLENNDDLPPSELRALAGNILKAADWLEGNQ